MLNCSISPPFPRAYSHNLPPWDVINRNPLVASVLASSFCERHKNWSFCKGEEPQPNFRKVKQLVEIANEEKKLAMPDYAVELEAKGGNSIDKITHETSLPLFFALPRSSYNSLKNNS